MSKNILIKFEKYNKIFLSQRLKTNICGRYISTSSPISTEMGDHSRVHCLNMQSATQANSASYLTEIK